MAETIFSRVFEFKRENIPLPIPAYTCNILVTAARWHCPSIEPEGIYCSIPRKL